MPVNCQKLSAVCVLVTVCACLFQGEKLVQAGGGIQCWPNPAATLLVTFEALKALGLARLVGLILADLHTIITAWWVMFLCR